MKSFKVKCLRELDNDGWFIPGKIYEVKDGVLTDETGYNFHYENPEELVRAFSSIYTFMVLLWYYQILLQKNSILLQKNSL